MAVREGLSKEVTLNPGPNKNEELAVWASGARTFPASRESKAKALK